MQTYHTHMARAENAGKRIRAKNSVQAKAIAEMIKDLSGAANGDDEELKVDESASRTVSKCPILSTDLVNPMKNVHCQHVYSLEGAFQLLLQRVNKKHIPKPTKLSEIPENIRVKCPVAGCMKFFTAKSLKRDFQAELSQRQKEATASEDAEGDPIDMCD